MTKKKVEFKHIPKSNELDSKGKEKTGRKPYCADGKVKPERKLYHADEKPEPEKKPYPADLTRALREAAHGTIGAGLGTNMTREQLKAKLGDRLIATGELRPVKGQKLSAGEGVNTVNKSVDTVTALLQEAIKRVEHVDEIDLDNVHEQLTFLEGVLAPVLIESQAGLGYTDEVACAINASDPAVIIQVKSLINMLSNHHNRMMGLIQRIEHLRNRVVL